MTWTKHTASQGKLTRACCGVRVCVCTLVSLLTTLTPCSWRCAVNCWLHRHLTTPFGGMKDSGVGREGGRHSLEFYSEYKNVCVMLDHKFGHK